MNTRELIVVLQGLISSDPGVAEYEVMTEGCDCSGNVGSVKLEDWGKQSVVYLERG